MKLTLFFCAGAIHVETHTDDISDMAGIGKRMPLTMAAFAVAAAGMAGIPLVAGFVSKWYLVIGALSLDGGLVFAAVLLVSGVLNIAYFWPIVYQAYFESPEGHDEKPLIEDPLGGRSELRADGGDVSESDNTDGDDTSKPEHVDHLDAHHEDHVHHGGPPEGGWDDRGWRGGESTWFMLGPILTAATLSLLLGTVPYTAVFLRIVDAIVGNLPGVVA
jgi:NADH-quinone oxidoreductase subunit L/multicomponent Na+:H+ antiporter subunit D